MVAQHTMRAGKDGGGMWKWQFDVRSAADVGVVAKAEDDMLTKIIGV